MNTKGLTVPEIVVALSIGAIVFLVLSSSQVLGFRITRDSILASKSRDVAVEQVELIRSYGYSAYAKCPAENPKSTLYPDAPACTDEKTVDDFTVAWEITPPTAAEPLGKVNWGGTSYSIIPHSTPSIIGVRITVTKDSQDYQVTTFMSCADAGDFSITSVPCPTDSSFYTAAGTS